MVIGLLMGSTPAIGGIPTMEFKWTLPERGISSRPNFVRWRIHSLQESSYKYQDG